MGKHLLLIGGAGYVGSVITSHFLREKYEVTVLDRFVYRNQFSVESYIGDSNYRLFYGDFTNESDLEKVSEGVTDVVILGGLVGDPITKTYPEESEEINSLGIKRCIDFFKHRSIDKLIFISTCSNYGLIKDNELADEDFELNPLSLYAKAKVAAEKYLLEQKGSTNYTGVVLRFATAFGLSPRMRFDLTVNEFTRDLFMGQELLVFDEHTWRPYCHVRDFARLIGLVIDADKQKVDFEVFNAGGEVNNATKKTIVETVQGYLPETKVNYTTQGSDPRNYKVDFSKVKSTLGFEPEYTIDLGVRELIDAMKSTIYTDSIENKLKYGNYELHLD